jgi:hypothetical protein
VQIARRFCSAEDQIDTIEATSLPHERLQHSYATVDASILDFDLLAHALCEWTRGPFSDVLDVLNECEIFITCAEDTMPSERRTLGFQTK